MKNSMITSADFAIASNLAGPSPFPDEELRAWGGKAGNLLRLVRSGFPVPPFLALSSGGFRHVMVQHPEILAAIQNLEKLPPESLESAAVKLRQHWIDAPFSNDLRQEVSSQLERLGLSREFVAVRSSASDEDGTDFSFAGMHDSFLFVRGLEAIELAIRRVWASAFHVRAIHYRLENRLPLDRLGVSVLIQKMVFAQSSGVMFSLNPANGRTDQVVVSSVWGAGEGLVSGTLPADTFFVNKQTGAIASEIVTKTEKLELDREHQQGTQALPVPLAQQTTPSLTDDQIREISRCGQQIEIIYRRPQDIEFCFDHSGKLYIVQTRPVTQVNEYGPAAGNRMVWDNSNIIESYSGVTTPMTFSFIRRAYTIVYHCFAEVMGIAPAKVRASRGVFENMLGLIRGRVYYNLPNWYRLIRLFPGFQYNAPFMESMMGLKEPLVLDDPVSPPGFWRKWLVELPALLRLVMRTSWNFWRIRPIVDRFQADFRRHYDAWDVLDFAAMSPQDLKVLYHQMEDALLWNWRAPIINDFYVMVNYGLLKHLCRQWAGDNTGALQNDLICGEGGVESAEPAKMLLRMAAMASADPTLKHTIETAPLVELPQRIADNPNFFTFQQQMELYLKQYGFRCMNELKLEEFSLRDRPHLVYQVLRNYLRLQDQSVLDVEAMDRREQATRKAAEQTAYRGIGGWLGFFRRWIFQRVLRNARLGVKNRENMRFARTRIYGLLREILRALGRHLASEKILLDSEDIFYLTIEEVWDFIQGTSVTTHLSELAQLRRREFQQYREGAEPSERFETFGYVYHKNLFQRPPTDAMPTIAGQLRGIGCCPGKIVGRVRVLRSPADDLSLSDEILVAERTDPGWVPLYPAVSGILIERGSVLSHSAVVAREMGIPTIVGISELLKHVRDGDVVQMDGGSGTVELGELDPASGAFIPRSAEQNSER